MPDVLAKPARWWPGIRAGHPLARGLVGYWPFWEGQGGKAYDVANPFDIANHGTFVSTPTWVGGASGWGVNTNGSSSRINVPGPPFPNITLAAFTIWMYAMNRETTGWSSMFGKGRDDGGRSAHLYLDGSEKLVFATLNDNQGGSSVIADGQVFQAAGVSTGSVKRLYLDGVLDAGPSSESTLADSPTSDLSFGGVADGSEFWAGDWYAAGVWVRDLIASEVDELAYDPYALIRPRAKTYLYATGGAPAASIVVLRRRMECA